ncbi:MAG TPA: tetratricopeptide repeat protein, partial [Zoogloea sp.]|nr:tetratricopeptide repeat protein [Zoogloea sp.]
MSAQIPAKKLDKLYALFSANQLEALERAARDCTRRHPAAAAGWQMLGASFLARQREQDALPHLQHAARLAPSDAAIQDNLGLTLLRLGQPAAAEAHFDQATRHDPQRVSAWVNGSQAARQAGQPARAEHCARQALALAPHSPEAHLNLGNALADQRHWEDAERHYRTAALCAPPGWIEPALNLSNLFDRQGRFADAAACLDTVSHTPAADWRVFSALGRARSMLGDTAAARDA